jgi:hypothetical protein
VPPPSPAYMSGWQSELLPSPSHLQSPVSSACMWSLPPSLPPNLPPSMQSQSPPLPEASPSWDADLSVENKLPKTPTQDHAGACSKAFVFAKPSITIATTPRTCSGGSEDSNVGEAMMPSSGSDSEHEAASTCTTPLGSGHSGYVVPPPGLTSTNGLPSKIGMEPVRPLCLSNLL